MRIPCTVGASPRQCVAEVLAAISQMVGIPQLRETVSSTRRASGRALSPVSDLDYDMEIQNAIMNKSKKKLKKH